MAHDTMALNQLHKLIYYYAFQVYGKNEIKGWLKANKEKSVLDHVTASDLAFTVLVYENYHPKWINDIETERVMEQHQNDTGEKDEPDDATVGQKRKNRSDSSAGPQLKYTKPANVRHKYLESGWNDEGFRRFKELQQSFHTLMIDDQAWQACKETWDDYVSNMKQFGNRCWVPQYSKLDLGDDDGDNDDIADTDEVKFEFVQPEPDALISMGAINVPEIPDKVVSD